MSEFDIGVETRYIDKESDPANRRFVFAYTITIENTCGQSAQLMNRYWCITDGEGEVQEVNGPGVVGKQPLIEPGTAFRYTSAAILETPVGSMRGHYEFQREGCVFTVDIPLFSLSVPNAVH